MIKIGYKRCEYDCCVYMRSLDDDSFIFLLLYMDDMFIVAKTIVEVNKLNVLLSKEFDMKDLGAAKKILRMEICRDKDAKRLWLSQVGYVKKVLERFSMENAKPISTPLPNHFHLSTYSVQRQLKKLKTCQRSHIGGGVSDVCYGMYHAKFGSCNQCGEQVYSKSEETTLKKLKTCQRSHMPMQWGV
jgi:hypothetical protein